MPFYDACEQRMVVRVVYDGVARAGKTTNLSQLSMLFAAQGRSRLSSAGDLRGRTMYFDWMQILAGVVCGFPLLCQMLTVPGQVVLTPRRRRLLESADVVVYVSDSDPSSIDAARASLELVERVAERRGEAMPIILQANKQDRVGALHGAALSRALGRDGMPFVEAIASEGVGVVDTFVAAIRTVARVVQAKVDGGDTRLQVARAESAIEVLAKLAEVELDPASAAEMLLEEAAAVLALGDAMAREARSPDLRAATDAAVRQLAEVELARAPIAPVSAAPSAAANASQPPSRVEAPATVVLPPLPSPDAPTGFVWPAHTGRAIVRALGVAGVQVAALDDCGELVHPARGYVLATSTRARFADAESARQALVRRARECTQLDRLLVPETVLVAQTAADGACWIWTVRPDVASIDRRLASDAPAELVASYAAAAVDALRASLRHGFTLDLVPRFFGVQQGMVRYVGEVVSEPPRAGALAASMQGAVDAVTGAGGDGDALLDAFERELQRRTPTTDDRARSTRPVRAAGAP